MNKIIEILMTRDGIDEETAREMLEETKELIFSSDVMEADQIMAEQLGLEPDYIEDLLDYA